MSSFKFAPHAEQNNDEQGGRGPVNRFSREFVVLVPGRTRIENQCQYVHGCALVKRSMQKEIIVFLGIELWAW